MDYQREQLIIRMAGWDHVRKPLSRFALLANEPTWREWLALAKSLLITPETLGEIFYYLYGLRPVRFGDWFTRKNG